MIDDIKRSTNAKNIDITVTTRMTAKNACLTCTFVGNITLWISALAFAINVEIFPILCYLCYGRPRGTRTPGTWFWRPVLYQLSYWPKMRLKKQSLLKDKTVLQFHLFMNSMFFTPFTIFLKCKFLCCCFFILSCMIITSCTFLTT